MAKITHHSIDLGFSAHWNRTHTKAVNAEGIGPPKKTPQYFSAPQYQATTDRVLTKHPKLTDTWGALVTAANRAGNALTLVGNSRATQALRLAAQAENAPQHLQQAAQDANALHWVAKAIQEQARALAHETAHRWRHDPWGQTRQLARSHIESQHDTGYAIAQTTDDIFRNPSLLFEPTALASMVLGAAIIPFRGRTPLNPNHGAGDKAPQIPYTYRSQTPLHTESFTIDTDRGPITAMTLHGSRSDFSLAIKRPDAQPHQNQIRTHIQGRNEGEGQLRILSFDTDQSAPRQTQIADLVTGLAWAATGPGHSAPTQRITIPIHAYSLGNQNDLTAFRQLRDPKTMAITDLLTEALKHFGIDITKIFYDTNPAHRYSGPSELVYRTQPNSRFGSTQRPQLNPKFPQNARLMSIASATPDSNRSLSGGLHPTARLQNIAPDALEESLRTSRQYGIDPLNPILVTRAYGADGRTHFLPVNDEVNSNIWALRLLTKANQPAPVVPTRATSNLTDQARQRLIQRASDADATLLFTESPRSSR